MKGTFVVNKSCVEIHTQKNDFNLEYLFIVTP